MSGPPEAPGRLVVCPTPIGNLEDVTLRVLAALRGADLVACEDTRRTRRLLERHDIHVRVESFHEHNERSRARELVSRIARGAIVALVSDAGMPLLSDPGYELVRACLRADLQLEVLPGPSAVATALVASGLPPEPFCFVGFLPRARAQRQTLLGAGARTLVAFESPQRLLSTLELLAELDPGRPAAVCRELTKLHEEVRRASALELAEHYRAHPPRGEVTLVVGPSAGGSGGAQESEQRARVLHALSELIAAGARPRPAARALSTLSGIPANELYAAHTRREDSLS